MDSSGLVHAHVLSFSGERQKIAASVHYVEQFDGVLYSSGQTHTESMAAAKAMPNNVS